MTPPVEPEQLAALSDAIMAHAAARKSPLDLGKPRDRDTLKRQTDAALEDAFARKRQILQYRFETDAPIENMQKWMAFSRERSKTMNITEEVDDPASDLAGAVRDVVRFRFLGVDADGRLINDAASHTHPKAEQEGLAKAVREAIEDQIARIKLEAATPRATVTPQRDAR